MDIFAWKALGSAVKAHRRLRQRARDDLFVLAGLNRIKGVGRDFVRRHARGGSRAPIAVSVWTARTPTTIVPCAASSARMLRVTDRTRPWKQNTSRHRQADQRRHRQHVHDRAAAEAARAGLNARVSASGPK